ncbi:MAG: ParB/RepB/Spo0J family partition protein [Bacteroidetes bacterium]|jgi:ParB family chromosome partitioning protein|nr:ParB/RepB/Spo0J family partition protein [Bacteroidota bacterium]MBP7256349.1 ParB/RepB/Spo0J family partition protein [Chitinophagales bacterium]MBK7139620.1 ParB/RepB/Spo0J family partition protein [Bacteroidota bacterium]MBK7504792.1 ParB/RepB/Spo0J family partition protein [Bacteroidota bacterium]MBK7638722.1 ParB/RepB/Spo0J family partition protein [Bacteroidota bacterium]
MSKTNSKQKLGLGIRALLEEIEEASDIVKINQNDEDSIINTVSKIALDFIEVNPFQPRVDFNEEALSDLMQSIKIHGVIQPITVRKIGPKKFQLIAGERRLRASKMAGQTDIPAYVREANDQESLEIALIENIQREDLNSMEIAITYKRLIDECEQTHEVVAERLGKDRSTVTNYLRLLKLPPEIQHALKIRNLTMGHARALIAITEVEKQLFAYKEIENKGLSVRKTEELVRMLTKGTLTPNSKSSNSTPDEALPAAHREIQKRLMDYLETRVKMKRSKQGKGEIIIPFYSDNDLNRLLALIENED